MSLPPASGTLPVTPVSADRSTTPIVPQSTRDGQPTREGLGFVDRRGSGKPGKVGVERRQFGSSHAELSADGRELALAIDRYKIQHHRRYLTCDEMLLVLAGLGYAKQD